MEDSAITINNFHDEENSVKVKEKAASSNRCNKNSDDINKEEHALLNDLHGNKDITEIPGDPVIKEEPDEDIHVHEDGTSKINGYTDTYMKTMKNACIKVEKDAEFSVPMCSSEKIPDGEDLSDVNIPTNKNLQEIDIKIEEDNWSLESLNSLQYKKSTPKHSSPISPFHKNAPQRNGEMISGHATLEESCYSDSLDDGISEMHDGRQEEDDAVLSMYITETSFDDTENESFKKTRKRKMVECKVCNKKLAQSYINIHMKIHTVGFNYICKVCNKGFKLRGSYNLHIKMHSEEKPHVCKECDKRFKRVDLLKTHMANVHIGYAPFKCDICGKCFTSNYRLQRHLLIHSDNKPYLCTECGQSFTQSHHLTDHMTRHTGIKAFRCEFCGKEFAVKGTLAKHVKTHDENKPYLCQHCGKNFYSSYNLKVHQRIHTGEKPYVCEVCGKGFTGSGYLKEHIAAVHLDFAKEAKQKTHECSVCQKGFSSKYKLSRHVRSHTGEKPHICDVCGKGYSQKGHLNDHILTHTNNYPYKCDLCGQGYKTANKLEIHTVKHLTSRTFQCKKCGEVFSTKEEKFNHNQEFHGHEFKFQCSDCPQMFKSSRELENHAVTHTGIRPYPCTFEGCGKRFTQISSLNMHMKRHSPEKKFKCADCGMCFYQKGCLKKHSLTHSKLGYKGKECEVCGTFYKDFLALQYHMKIHEGEFLFDCDKCFKSFNSKKNLEQHQLTRCEERFNTGDRIHSELSEEEGAAVICSDNENSNQ